MINEVTRALHHLEQLCVAIGPRPIGSPGANAAAAYAAEVFRAAGLDVQEQPYACRVWEHAQTHLELDGASLAVDANAFSPACDVTGQTVAVGTIAELEMADLRGRIGLLYGDLTREPLSAKSWFLKTERDDVLVALLEHQQPAALITIQPMTTEYEQGIEDWEFAIPSATVPPAVGLTLLQRNGATVHLSVDSRQYEGQARNIVGRIRGSGASKVVLCAHYDTKINTPGAVDNGAGVAVMLSLAQELSGRSLTHDLEFIAFTGEEYLPLGDDEYVRRCGGEFDRIVAAINFDGVGSYPGATSIMLASGSPALQRHVTELTRRFPGVVWVDPWPESNHSTFSMRGVPSVALSAVGSRRLAHYPADTAPGISPFKLGEVIAVAEEIVMGLQDKTPTWSRGTKE